MIFGSAGEALLTVWVAFALMGVAALGAVLVWAARAGQFSNQDRARRLPLESRTPDDRHV
jgi:nitrogen fixation-related uncharacterized protein